jgi:dolichol-phosphate mannosyltransferase
MRALIVIPTFNERQNLETLLPMLLSQDYRVLVVDDASPDGSGATVDALTADSNGRLRCIHRTGPRGLGLAYVAGFTEAVRSDSEIICQMDADFSHHPEEIGQLTDAIRHNDLVIGSRYLGTLKTPRWPLHRRLLSRFANTYARRFARLTQADCTSGFRCWRRDALARIDFSRIVSRGYAFQVEMLVAAVRKGLRIIEVPTSFRDRAWGSSKMSPTVIAESALIPWRIRGWM